MSRHVADKRSPSEGGRVINFVSVARQDREEGSHPAARALHRRDKVRDGESRLREFTRIARGQEA